MSIETIVKLITSLLTSPTIGSKNSSKSQPLVLSEVELPVSRVTLKDGYYVWDKLKDSHYEVISEHFRTTELQCRCSFPECKEQKISKDLIDRLEKVRIEVGCPLIVTSAYRCTPYQEYLRNVGVNTVVAKKSTHELGDAADVIPKKGTIKDFEPICAKYFDSIGLAKNFLHLDTRRGYRRWDY